LILKCCSALGSNDHPIKPNQTILGSFLQVLIPIFFRFSIMSLNRVFLDLPLLLLPPRFTFYKYMEIGRHRGIIANEHIKLFWSRPWLHGHRWQHTSMLPLSPWIHGLRSRKLHRSVAVTPAHIRVLTQTQFVPSFTSVVG
jgi:hypothetical protein